MKKILMCIIILFSIIFTSCSDTNTNKKITKQKLVFSTGFEEPKYESVDIPGYLEDIYNFNIIALKDNNLIYIKDVYRGIPDTGDWEYYKFNIDTNENIYLGTITNFTIYGPSFIIVGDKIFFTTLSDDERVYGVIDINENKLTEIKREKDNIAVDSFITLLPVDDHRYIEWYTKLEWQDLNEYSIVYHVLLHNIDGRSKEIITKRTIGNKNFIGFQVCDDKIVTLEYISGKRNPYLVTYDLNGYEISREYIEILDNILGRDILFNSNEFYLFNDYFILRTSYTDRAPEEVAYNSKVVILKKTEKGFTEEVENNLWKFIKVSEKIVAMVFDDDIGKANLYSFDSEKNSFIGLKENINVSLADKDTLVYSYIDGVTSDGNQIYDLVVSNMTN
ncbi:hypothetical protein FACS1894132_09300 [Clostridia bacterium]|nr:hypothetical protein FACS1894132_09300 [Clostridia bacterium]